MSATQDTTTDWREQAVRLRLDQKMPTIEIAEMFGKSASQVRKVIAAANAEKHVNGTGPYAEPGEQHKPNFDGPHPSIVWGGVDVNMAEFADFIGRTNGKVFAQKVALPTATEHEFVYAEPGDTVIRVGDNAFEVRRPNGVPEVVNMPPHEPQGDIEAALEKPEDPLHAFKAEAGEAVGEMPKAPEPEQESYEVRLKGTRQMALDFGPEADVPVGATLTFKSEKFPSGFYGGGDVITGTFTARITDVPYKEKLDKASEEYRAKPTAYVATITEITVNTDQ